MIVQPVIHGQILSCHAVSNQFVYVFVCGEKCSNQREIHRIQNLNLHWLNKNFKTSNSTCLKDYRVQGRDLILTKLKIQGQS